MAIRTFNSVGGFSVGENPTTVILANGDITTGNGTFSGNVQANNAVKTDSLLKLDGTPWDFQQPAGTANGQIQYFLSGDFGASSKFVWDPTSNTLTANGNINTVNISSNGFINTIANINAAFFNGNFVGNTSGNVAVPGGVGSNTQVVFSDGGNINTAAGFTFNKSTNAVIITGNLTTDNSNLGNLAIANYFTGVITTASSNQPNITSVGTMTGISMDGSATISGGNLVSANFLTGTITTALQPNITQVGTLGNLSVQGNITYGINVSGGNLVSANFLAGTLTTSAQPNITSLGTLGNLVVTGNANVNGNVNAANLAVPGKVITSLIPSPHDNQTLGNSGNVWNALFVSNINIGTTYIRSTGNTITMDGANLAGALSSETLTVRNDASIQGNATITGNLTVAGNTTYINVTNLDIKDPLISMGGSGNGGNATAYDGKDRGMVLLNYYSNGSGPINEAFIWKTASNEFQAISQINNITNEVVTASAYANIRGASFIGNLDGFVSANQYQITTVGTLGNLTVSGNLQVNAAANIATLRAGGLNYPIIDGSSSQVLSTYGNGNLYWATISTSQLANGNSNITVYNNGNVTVSSNGVANILNIDGVSANPTVRITGNANLSGTLNVGNTTVANLLIGNTTVRANTVTTTSTSANQTIVTFSTTGVRGAIFDVKGEESGGGKYSIATVYCVHDSTGNVDYSVVGTVTLGGSTGSLAVNVVGSNIFLGVTPTSSNSTVWTTQYRTI